MDQCERSSLIWFECSDTMIEDPSGKQIYAMTVNGQRRRRPRKL